MKNVRPFDRFLRAAVAVVLFEAGYFWLGGPWNWICFGLGAILLLTAIMGICPLYRLLGIASAPAKQQRRPVLVALAALLLAALVIGGAYGSMFFSRKLFLEDFNAMNAHYKQALFLTGKGDRQGAVRNLDQLEPAFEAFSTKYTQLSSLCPQGRYRTHQVISLPSRGPCPGRSAGPHRRPPRGPPCPREGPTLFQKMFKRNGFSMLSVALVDFHDAMETILAAATAKNVAGVASIYPGVSEKSR